MRPINITTPDAEHAPMLAQLGAQTFCQSYSSALDPRELKAYVDNAFSEDQIAKELVDPDMHYCIASMGSTICAYGKLAPSSISESLKKASPIELQRLYVTPECWGQGVGSRLMTRLIDMADTCGYQHLWLRVWQENHWAKEFYQRWQFSICG